MSGERRLEESGAELEITYTDMDPQVWPLARHYRIEHQEEGVTLLWLRPIFPSYAHEGERVFHIGECRPRGFLADTIRANPDGTLSGEISYGYGAFIIRPVSPEQRAEMDEWDDFTLLTLDDALFDILEQCAEDSWEAEWE